jgi:exopolysaccharide biosynthesis polyprenyl glycosylphosphotransferase
MKRSEILFGIIRIPLDILSCMSALMLAYHLRSANIDLLPHLQLLSVPSNLPPLPYYIENFVIPTTLTYIIVLASLRLYSLRLTLGPWREISRIIIASVLWIALIMAWFFLVQKQLFFSRALLIIATVLLTFFSLLGRSILILFQRKLLQKGIGVRRVLSCGSMQLPSIVWNDVQKDPRYTYTGHVSSAPDVVQKHQKNPIDLVLHIDANPTSADTVELIDSCRSNQIDYAFVPPIFTDVPHLLGIGAIGLTPILQFRPTPLDGWGRVFKRGFDLSFGLLFTIIALPMLIIIALMILVSMGLPIFYVSKRIGKGGRTTVPVLKFRTMCKNADDQKNTLQHLSHRADGPLFKIKKDPRVTPLGRILRRFSLDELPQLFNVLMGQLSLVGPRPHLPDEVAKYSAYDKRVFTVRPGITGLAQISGRSDLSFEEEVQQDLRYIEDWSAALDLWILWRTGFVVLFGRGAD